MHPLPSTLHPHTHQQQTRTANPSISHVSTTVCTDHLLCHAPCSFLVLWADGTPESWEPEEHVSPELVEQLRAQRPELFKKKKKKKQRDIYELPPQRRQKKAGKSSSNGNGSSNGGGGGEQAAAAEPVRERVALFR
jgi:hypothetical protein